MTKLFFLFASLTLLSLGCQGTRPDNIGAMEGRLTPCPESDNCVSTSNNNALHRIEPFPVKGGVENSMNLLRRIIQDSPRTALVVDKPGYLHAEFTSQIMRYVDDVEFFAPDAATAIQVRSASRLGAKDFGVNRKRIDAIREQYLAK